MVGVHCNGQIGLVLDVRQFLHQQLVHRRSLGAGLASDEIFAQQGPGHVFGFIGGVDDFYPARVAPATSVDLGFQNCAATHALCG